MYKKIIICCCIIFSLYIGFTYHNRSYISPSPLCKDCSIILVSLDTLGATHLPCYGYTRVTAPQLCRFSNQGIKFENAYSNATWTLPSHVSIFTGLYPSAHGITTVDKKLPQNIPFLPDLLQKMGYTTLFLMPNHDPTLPLDNVYYRGISKLYDLSPNRYDQQWLPILNDYKQRILKHEKTFLFLHTYYVHDPYLPIKFPLIYANGTIPEIPLFSQDIDAITNELVDLLIQSIPPDIQEHKFNAETKDSMISLYETITKQGMNQATKRDIVQKFDKQHDGMLLPYKYIANYINRINRKDPRHIEYVKALYDQKIRELDSSLLTDLITFMSDETVKNNTILIITSDHGEEFMEHNQLGHITLYDPNTKIPFFLFGPSIKPQVIHENVQSADIFPTILELIGTTISGKINGKSLVPLLLGKKEQDNLLITDSVDQTQKVLRKKAMKLTVNIRDGVLIPYELFDTKRDPGEQMNLISSHLKIAQQILHEYNTNSY